MKRRVHFVGIGGSGISAIARVMLERGDSVRGSDRAESEYTAGLEAAGVEIMIGHRAENLMNPDLVIASSAIPEDNPELVAAREAGIRVFWRPEFLKQLTAGSQTVAVAGTHGKSTTTGLIAWLLESAGIRPSFIVGAVLVDMGTNARAGGGPHFVIEADEYKQTFLGLDPSVAVITNVEHDHPDCFPKPEDSRRAFSAFTKLVRDLLVVCADDPGSSALTKPGLERWTYGLSSGAKWRAEALTINEAGGMDFRVLCEGKTVGKAHNLLPGEDNIRNCLAALAVSDYLGVPLPTALEAMAGYHGVQRRFQVLGREQDVIVIDDYAHHPTEIASTLAAARMHYPDFEIWAVFQPHTYSRTKTLLNDLVGAFIDADHVIVLDIFAAREERDAEISGAILAERIQHSDARFLSNFPEATQYLLEHVRPQSLVLSLSAGNGNQVVIHLLQALKLRGREDRDGGQSETPV
ncbi:MAG TPA: UDP-N-acetylmuramate--L-alanine ligase [Anaerolineae bacterium]|nr:UDP-N-acetylmuramate--L-alanine ligase [Anaerolineae bacterium]